ncbi:MAG: hypothetical protein KIS79_08050, partial [Burkholderiales bacterium]|nr:hypothetical protein [Burkholderiales bacterium]
MRAPYGIAMQEPAQIPSLLARLAADLQNIDILWQVGALTVCLLLAWILTRRLARGSLARDASAPGPTLPDRAGELGRVVLSLTALLLVLLARRILQQHQPSTHLLDVAVPLLFSFCLVHGVSYLLRHAFSPSSLLHYWERAIAWAIWIGLALHITGLLEQLRELLDDVT